MKASNETSIEPWLTVKCAAKAVKFYKAAFDAIESYRLETPDGGLVVKLSVGSANFWIAGDNTELEQAGDQSLACDNIRMILTVNDPNKFFAKALGAGASEVFPVGEQHGWRIGRLVDPFGLHWEIGKLL